MIRDLINRSAFGILALTLTGSLATVAAAGNCGSANKTASASNSKDCQVTCTTASDNILAANYQRGGYGTKKDIVDTAVDAGSFNTLVAAVKAAGLVDTLKGDGPFTVFAPSDAAFAKLPHGTVENLLKPENRDQLVAVLTYHVVPGKVKAADVVNRSFAPTVNGQRADIEVRDGNVFVDNARVVSTDIGASNGVIHVIDSVILPETNNIVDIANSAGQFGTLLAAAKAAGLADTLMSGEFTVLAPTDDAFAKLPHGTVQNLLKPENREQLRSILLYHVIPGRVYADQAITAARADTAQGQAVNFAINKGRLQVNGANVIDTDITASNGVIHVIDRVILPN